MLAGITVAFVALPLAIAFGLIAFGPTYGPAAGLWSAIIAGALATLLGGSPYNITGPTVVLAVFTGGLIVQHGGFNDPDALTFGFFAVALSGVFQILFGVFRLAKAIEYIPYPVISGYMNGVAVLIFLSGMKDVLAADPAGLADGTQTALLAFVAGRAAPVVYGAALLAAAAFAITFLYPKLTTRLPDRGIAGLAKRVPGSLLALFFLSALAVGIAFFAGAPRVQELPHGGPAWSLNFGVLQDHPDWTRDLVLGALGLAAISSIETLLSCVIADGFVGRRTSGNREMVAQGVANTVSGGLGANQVCGAAVRTMVSLRNGGRTRLAGLTHSLFLLALLLVGAGLVTRIPIAVLSGILLVTGFTMVDWRSVLEARRSPKSDVAVMAITTVVTVGFGVVEAVLAGVVLSAFLFIRRMTELTDFVGEPEWTGREREGMEGLERQVLVYEIRGPLFFGPAARFSKTFDRANLKEFKVVIFRMNAVTAMDQTGLRSVDTIVDRLHDAGQAVIFSHLPEGPHRKFERYGLVSKVGAENIVESFPEAVGRARALLGLPPRAAGGGEATVPG